MEGYPGHPPPSLIPRFWAPGWNSVQALNKFQDEVGGPLSGGDPGERLIEPTPAKKTAYFENVPAGFEPRAGEWLLLPLHHIFGSEELSALAPGYRRAQCRSLISRSTPPMRVISGWLRGMRSQLRLRQRRMLTADGSTGIQPEANSAEVYWLPRALQTRVAARYCRAPRRPARSGWSCGNRLAGMGRDKEGGKG